MFRAILSLILAIALFAPLAGSVAEAQSGDGSIGVEGQISAPAPTSAATISSPVSGANFSNVPITVTGICQSDLLVKLFKNGVFAGSALCVNGAYAIQTDLFSGTNELVAIVFDDLDQEGPESNRVSVEYIDGSVASPVQRVALSSNFARRGANPGQDLNWPISISGGTAPYAISINWGDGRGEQLLSVALPGEFTPTYQYQASGSYTVTVKATDSVGRVGYLQLVAVANGPLDSSAAASDVAEQVRIERTIIWWPVLLLAPFVVSTFWLGSRYRLKKIKDKIQKGELPFNLS